MMPRLLRLSDVRQTAVDVAPPGYRLVRAGLLDLQRITGLSFVGLLVALPLFLLLSGPLGGPVDLAGRTLRHGVGAAEVLLSLLGATVVLPVVHELIHGAAAALIGARPVYGIVPPVAAFCHFERLVTRGQYAIITVAPLLVISVVGLALMPVTPGLLQWPLLALLIANAAGAIGDVWLLAQLRAVPAQALIADTAVGFEVYLPAGE